MMQLMAFHGLQCLGRYTMPKNCNPHKHASGQEAFQCRGIPPQIIVIYTTMSPILFIFGPKVPPQVVFKNPKNFWPRTPRGRDMAI